MTSDRFTKFCIVGVGGHARTKLMPAIAANGQSVAAVVSSQPAQNFPDTAVFIRLEDAIEKLPRDTAFFIATPPALHFAQAERVLQAGFDLFLEKPAFVTGEDAERIVALTSAPPRVLVEGFMHRYTQLYSELLAVWTASRERVRRIEISFLIDKMPPGTFRQETNVVSSALYDIGCYPLSLLADIGLGQVGLSVSGLQFAGDPDRTRIRITGSAGQIAVDLDIGVAGAYANSVCLHMSDGETICFSPFFYGRKAERTITTSSGGKTAIRTLSDENAFEVMLARPRSAWLADQAGRSRQMIEVAGRLEGLAQELSAVGLGGRIK
jgi:predicted dehydrogenase